ncbi:MAG: hypothetical protein HIU86_05510 [Acidobacteria bacterium]|nr:hypothetical protein [Acidobacteriota bacterium]
MVTKAESRNAAREKAAAQRAALAARQRRNRRIAVAAVVVGTVVVAGGVVLGVESGIAASATAATRAAAMIGTADRTAEASAAAGRTTAAPWALPADVESAVRSAGLSMLTTEGTALHIHQHLSITVDGKAITVPADLGIDVATQQLSALHTHDTSGILHVESPVQRTFHLAQAFAEWDVRLGKGEIGPWVDGKGGTRVAVFVDGKPYAGDPRAIVLKSHEDIDVVVTTDGTTPKAPAAFVWPSGY